MKEPPAPSRTWFMQKPVLATSIGGAGVLALFVFLAEFRAWQRSLPNWQLSAHNSPEGVVVEVFQSSQTEPNYRTILAGKTISTEVERISRTELPPELGETTFYDETLGPGRWTLVLAGTELDIMERAMMVDETIEIAPHD